jgi:hypothetical protein
MKVPDMLEQHGSRDKLPWMAHQVFDQAELLRLEFDYLVAAPEKAPQQIHLKIADAERGARFR